MRHSNGMEGGASTLSLDISRRNPGDNHLPVGYFLKESVPLPGHTGKDALTSRFESFVRVAGDHLNSVQTSLDKRLQKLTPVDFGLAQFGTDAQDGSFSVGKNTDGNQHSTVHNRSAVAHFFCYCTVSSVNSIEVHIPDRFRLPVQSARP